jgi:ABC-type branched-subunit amino acid transport system permease subunit
VAGVVVLGGLAALGPSLDGAWLLRAERGLAMAGVFASLIVLAGLSGQISLAHTAFVGTGAFVMGGLAGGLGLPFGVALVLAGLAAVPVAIFVALPAIRLHGLHVALLTFGFGLVVAKFFESRLTGGTTGTAIPRPSFAATDRAYFWVLLALAGVLLLAARNLHRSPSGRVLGAIRDSEVAARSVGVSIPVYRLAVFGVAAFMAGISGAALGALQGLVTFQDVHPLFSLMWLSVAVIGGLGSIWGAVVAAAIWAFAATSSGPLAQLGFGLGAMFLARNERGVVGVLAELPRRIRRLRPTLARAAAAHDGRAVDGPDGAEPAREPAPARPPVAVGEEAIPDAGG